MDIVKDMFEGDADVSLKQT
ncbi:hypothetical protein POX_b02034 [Penicillium oxalicum]|uniref:Uncharacterized protein n=1 Tax=Penicillium oxalicum (strain 114-2 / CGMCC 5302) TaxID=933388 RepID=S7ZKY7_PENO1|nr:hypothetical protein POX_b02034 [Penicillium oxalicum]EPS30974.1 hypothetical protein PDE_05928 [Penicillium oxalicum 114-2]KAI2792003.1 hypothetical protein POX_b02034 [Penicillium oxalicum]